MNDGSTSLPQRRRLDVSPRPARRRDRVAAPPFPPALLDPSQIVAEARVLGEALRERTHDRERLLQMAARPIGLALHVGRCRQICQDDKEVALPLGMPRIGARQPAADLQPLLISCERAGEIALRKKNVAPLSQADRHVPLALGMNSDRRGPAAV